MLVNGATNVLPSLVREYSTEMEFDVVDHCSFFIFVAAFTGHGSQSTTHKWRFSGNLTGKPPHVATNNK